MTFSPRISIQLTVKVTIKQLSLAGTAADCLQLKHAGASRDDKERAQEDLWIDGL